MVSWELRGSHGQQSRDLTGHDPAPWCPSKVSRAEPAKAARFHRDPDPQESVW